MKLIIKLIGIFIILILFSCSNPIKEIENPEKSTSVETYNKIIKDTVCYKIVIENDILYIAENNVVKYITINKNVDFTYIHSGWLFCIIMFLIVFFLITIIVILE